MPTRTASTTFDVPRAATATRGPSSHRRRLGREVWPLLGTIGTTELIAAGAIAWFSTPAVAPAAITGLGVGAAGVGALALALRVLGRLTAPQPAPQRIRRSV